MVKLIKMKVDMDISYMFCYSNEAEDIEIYEGNWYIPNTGIELDKATQVDLDDESKDELSRLRGKNCSSLHEVTAEYQEEDFEIEGKPKVTLRGEIDGTEVYETESPGYVKLDDNGVKKTLLIKGLIMCLAVFITNGIYLVGYHLVSRNQNTKAEIDKKIQLQNLLRRFGMTPDNSTLLFYGQTSYKSEHSEPIEDLVSLLGYKKYKVYDNWNSSVTFSNNLLLIKSREIIVPPPPPESKESKE